MKKIIIGIISVLTFCSCNYLDIVPDNVATIDYAFRTKTSAESYLFTCYSWLPNHAASSSIPSFYAGDEIWLYPNIGREGWEIALGNQNVVNPILNYWSGENSGRNLYRGIRECNIFLENISRVAEMSNYEKEQWSAEVKFLKAYYHFYLMRMYGPIPIMDENLPIDIEPKAIYTITRQPIDKIVDYIVNLLNEASGNLLDEVQFEVREKGRITKPIAKAFKARVLITAASPLFNGNTDYAHFKNSDGEVLFSQEVNTKKWERAAEAAKEAVEAAHGQGYSLHYFTKSTGSNAISDTTKTLLNIRTSLTERWNNEIIWGNPNSMVNSIQKRAQPRLYGGAGHLSATNGTHAPPIKIAEMFYSENGVPIEEDITFAYRDRFDLKEATENDKLYLKPGERLPRLHFNREPRFYASLGFDAGRWYGNGWFSDDDLKYIDGRAGGIAAFHPTNYSVTGYYTKKVINYLNTADDDTYSIEKYPYPVIRLADVYLMYAEALNEAYGPSSEVYQYLDLIRLRSGLKGIENSWSNFSSNPDKHASQEGLREIIHQERLIELAFEGHRYWDIRRWKKAIEYFNQPITGWTIDQSDSDDYYRQKLIFNQEFKTRDYLWPIKEAEMLRNKNLIQAPGW